MQLKDRALKSSEISKPSHLFKVCSRLERTSDLIHSQRAPSPFLDGWESVNSHTYPYPIPIHPSPEPPRLNSPPPKKRKPPVLFVPRAKIVKPKPVDSYPKAQTTSIDLECSGVGDSIDQVSDSTCPVSNLTLEMSNPPTVPPEDDE